MSEPLIDVEVAYAMPDEQAVIPVTVPGHATVESAICASGLLSSFPELDKTALDVGIFGSACKLEQPLKQGDRVEIYRPLVHDPKEARRQRAAK
ncbi:MAG: RnfH family protein [Methylovulum sp.]|nr:RnfH family protein [Methylovulum sp.]